MDENFTTIIIALVSALSGGSAWSFYVQRVTVRDDKDDHNGQKLFRADLLDRIKYLEGKIDVMLEEKMMILNENDKTEI